MGELVTGYDDAFSTVAALTTPAMRHYADRLGLKFSIAHFESAERAPAWSKLTAIKAALERGADPVIWIDADALVVRADDIREVMAPTKDFFVSGHTTPHGFVVNTGVILVRNTGWSLALLDKIWNAQLCPEHRWWEQAAFMQLAGLRARLGRGEFDNPQQDILERVGWFDRRWNAEVLGGPVRGAVIRHYAGIAYESRVRLIHRDLRLPPSVGDRLMPALAFAELRHVALANRMEAKAQSGRGRLATAYYRSRAAMAQAVRNVLCPYVRPPSKS